MGIVASWASATEADDVPRLAITTASLVLRNSKDKDIFPQEGNRRRIFSAVAGALHRTQPPRPHPFPPFIRAACSSSGRRGLTPRRPVSRSGRSSRTADADSRRRTTLRSAAPAGTGRTGSSSRERRGRIVWPAAATARGTSLDSARSASLLDPHKFFQHSSFFRSVLILDVTCKYN